MFELVVFNTEITELAFIKIIIEIIIDKIIIIKSIIIKIIIIKIIINNIIIIKIIIDINIIINMKIIYFLFFIDLVWFLLISSVR